MTDTDLSVGEASTISGVAPDALRYYEREGIIGPIERDSSGHRRFSPNDLEWLGVVTCMREAGLGISDLRAFARMVRSDHAPAGRVEFLRDRREALRQRLDALGRAIDVLDGKIAYYDLHTPSGLSDSD